MTVSTIAAGEERATLIAALCEFEQAAHLFRANAQIKALQASDAMRQRCESGSDPHRMSPELIDRIRHATERFERDTGRNVDGEVAWIISFVGAAEPIELVEDGLLIRRFLHAWEKNQSDGAM